MPTIQWSSLVCDDAGRFDYSRVRSLASVLLAVLAGLVVVAAAVIELGLRQEVPHTALLIAIGALVAPLTGGKIGDALASRFSGKPDADVIP